MGHFSPAFFGQFKSALTEENIEQSNNQSRGLIHSKIQVIHNRQNIVEHLYNNEEFSLKQEYNKIFDVYNVAVYSQIGKVGILPHKHASKIINDVSSGAVYKCYFSHITNSEGGLYANVVLVNQPNNFKAVSGFNSLKDLMGSDNCSEGHNDIEQNDAQENKSVSIELGMILGIVGVIIIAAIIIAAIITNTTFV